MALLLVMDRDKTSTNSVKDRGCYKQGDVIAVYDDLKKCNIPPAEPFYIIKVVTSEKLPALMDEGKLGLDKCMASRRQYYIDFMKLEKDRLIKERYLEVTLDQFNASLVDRSRM